MVKAGRCGRDGELQATVDEFSSVSSKQVTSMKGISHFWQRADTVDFRNPQCPGPPDQKTQTPIPSA